MNYVLEITEEAEEKFWATQSGEHLLSEAKYDYLDVIMLMLGKCTTDEEVMSIDMPEDWKQYVHKEPDPEPKFGQSDLEGVSDEFFEPVKPTLPKVD